MLKCDVVKENRDKYERYAELVGKYFTGNLSEEEEKELKELGVALDDVEKKYFQRAKQSLQETSKGMD